MNPVIVQVVQHLSPGGIETMALDLMQQIGKNCIVHVISLESDKAQALKHWPRLQSCSDNLHFMDKQPGIRMNLVFELSALLQKLNATAVHSHHIGPLFYAGLAAKLAGVSTHVHTEHDAWHLNANSNRRLQRILLTILNPTLVADCRAVAVELKARFPFADPLVILNGIDTQRFVPCSEQQRFRARASLKIPHKSGTLVGCAARLEAVKGHEMLLEALSQTHQDICLALAGDGSLRQHLKKKAADLGISNRVYFLGALDDMVTFYQAIDLFCLPSLNEGLPLSPLEAQACGVPVVVSRVGGCSSIVCPNTGELIPPGNVSCLTAALIRHACIQSPYSPRKFVLKTGNLEQTARAYRALLTREHALELTL